MNEIDCKIVLEEYVLLHEAYENQEFKRLLLELECGGASASHRAASTAAVLRASGIGVF